MAEAVQTERGEYPSKFYSRKVNDYKNGAQFFSSFKLSFVIISQSLEACQFGSSALRFRPPRQQLHPYLTRSHSRKKRKRDRSTLGNSDAHSVLHS